jgi:hypothetical protein
LETAAPSRFSDDGSGAKDMKKAKTSQILAWSRHDTNTVSVQDMTAKRRLPMEKAKTARREKRGRFLGWHSLASQRTGRRKFTITHYQTTPCTLARSARTADEAHRKIQAPSSGRRLSDCRRTAHGPGEVSGLTNSGKAAVHRVASHPVGDQGPG